MPLAHIIFPQILRKTQEIEAALGHAPTGYLDRPPSRGEGGGGMGGHNSREPINGAPPPDMAPPSGVDYQQRVNTILGQPAAAPAQTVPTQRGYLNASAPTNTVRARPYDKVPPKNEGFDPGLNPMLAEAEKYAAKPSDRADVAAYKAGVMRGFNRRVDVESIPNAEVATQPAPVRNKRGKVVIKGAPGEAVGITESGQPIDTKGRKLGYLKQPALVTPYGDVAIRTTEKNKGDVSLDDQDEFAAITLEQMYGPHLKELESNNGKFPPGYFKVEYDAAKKAGSLPKGMSLDDYTENVKKGIAELRRREKRVQT